MKKTLKLKIPGKVIINGSYIVLKGEKATCVTINRYLHVESHNLISDNFDVVVNIRDRESYSFVHSESSYISKIIEAFYEVTRIVPSNHLTINMNFDKDFFINQTIKTGIGSSACIFTGLIYSLMYFNGIEISDLNRSCSNPIVKLMYNINKVIAPNSSGADVMSCLLGNVNFSLTEIEKIPKLGNFLVLGSFGKCTSTRNALKHFNKEDERWNRITQLNKVIIKTRSKQAYRDYLNELSQLNDVIVPKKQYEILKKTFVFDIFGCGISGAGGEDAVWCIVNAYEEVETFWKSQFDYVIVTEIVDSGLEILQK